MPGNKINIVVFAGLKDFFEPHFEVENTFSTIQDVFDYMAVLNPGSEQLLKKCRFAVSNAFVDMQFRVSNIGEVSVLPPSSGG